MKLEKSLTFSGLSFSGLTLFAPKSIHSLGASATATTNGNGNDPLHVQLSTWADSEDCSRHADIPPDTISRLTLQNSSGTNKTGNAFYDDIVQINPFQQCGNLQIPLEQNEVCCVSFIKPYQHENVRSGFAVVLKSTNEGIRSANGEKYCRLSSLLGNDSMVQGNTDLFISANSKCANGAFKCNPDGKLMIYTNTDRCEGSPALTLDLVTNSTIPAIPDLRIGENVKGSIHVFNQNKLVTGWTTYIPSTHLVPEYRNPLEVMETVLFIAALFLQSLLCYDVFQKWQLRKTQQLFLLFTVNTVMLTFIAFRMAYLYALFDNYYAMALLGYTQMFLYAFSTLLVTLYTAHFTILILQPTEQTSKNVYLAVISTHLLLAGSFYFLIFAGFSLATRAFLIQWTRLFFYWLIIYFLSNTLPLTVVLWLRTGIDPRLNIIDRIDLIHELDPWYLFCVGLSFAQLLVYIWTSILQSGTSILESDRGYLAVTSIKVICVVSHSALSTHLNDKIRVLLALTARKPPKVRFADTDDTQYPENTSSRGAYVDPFHDLGDGFDDTFEDHETEEEMQLLKPGSTGIKEGAIWLV